MGSSVDGDGNWERFELRPFQSSATFHNLHRTGQGVLHITDDVLPFAQAVVGFWTSPPTLIPARNVQGWIIADACRWVEFEVVWADEAQMRASMQCRAVDIVRNRDFLGFNRAKHAVIETAILASRVQFIPWDVLETRFADCRQIVARTGGPRENDALDMLWQFVQNAEARAGVGERQE